MQQHQKELNLLFMKEYKENCCRKETSITMKHLSFLSLLRQAEQDTKDLKTRQPSDPIHYSVHSGSPSSRQKLTQDSVPYIYIDPNVDQ